MARGPSNSPNRKSPAKKTPAKTKRGKAPARGAQKRTKVARKSPAARVAKRTARKAAKGVKAAKAPKAARKSVRRATKRAAPATPPAQTQGSEEKGGDAPPSGIGRVEVLNANVPGYRSTVDARKYHAMKDALLAILPPSEPGLTQAEMFAAVDGKLPEDVFPGQEKLGWWVKCVQLDLEARGGMRRSSSKPLRWHRVR